MTAGPRASAALLTIGFALLVLGPGEAAMTPAQTLAEQLQKKYETIKDFSADFVHVYVGGVLRKRVTERGHVLIKKPGRMRWDYTAPEQKLFVSDGVKIYSYIVQDKQVLVSMVPRDDQATTPILFLAGKGDIVRDFTASSADAPLTQDLPTGCVGLKLIPKTHQAEYDWVVVGVQVPAMTIVGLVTMDAQGGKSSLSFTNLKENVGLADKAFAFKIPRGVDVIDDPSRR